ncbi:DNA-binding transcriptional regulator, LysR family [Lachnospiraceae bacterium XBB1006]|nr:DNA-binding transcriptional regulator, LysR family [Lachnospiraceae bacterium XBB1006]
MNDINYEYYKIFYEVAKFGSFSKAAKKLYVSQSAVSQSIKSLEEKLGRALFVRTTKSVSLTPAGEMLFSHVEPALRLLSQGQRRITQENTLEGGQLHIGAPDTICRYFLLPYLRKFHRLYPRVSIKVTNQSSLRCVDLLSTGEVDCVVTNTPNSRLTGEFSTRIIGSFHDVFVAGSGYLPLKNQTLSLKELSEYPILMLDRQSTTSEFLHDLFYREQLQLEPEIELGSNDLLIDLAKISLGIAFVPDFCLPTNPKDLFVVSTLAALPKRHMVSATLRSVPNSPVVDAFLALLPEVD